MKKKTKKTAAKKTVKKKTTKKSESELTVNQQLEYVMEVFNSQLSQRSQLLEKVMDPRRDMNEECGFPRDDPSYDHYRILYGRNPLARKACDIKPNHCFKSTPTVFENKDDEVTPFEKDWEDLQKSLRIQGSDNEKGYYGGNDGSVVWDILKRADKMAARGKYSVIFLGFNDDKEPSQPVEASDSLELMYVTAYTAEHADVTKWENDNKNPRFGRPEIYKLGNTVQLMNGTNVPNQQFSAHHSRIIHVTHEPESADSVHEPLLKVLFNVLHGSDKIIGSGPEAYFRMCFTHLVLKSKDGITKDDVDETSVREQIYNYENSLQKVMSIFGFDVEQISPDIVDPGPFLNMLIELICIIIDCPKRIFMGTERGELASSQDKSEWNEVIEERRINLVNPRLIIPFVERLINLRVLSEPAEFHIEWENLDKMSEVDQIGIAANVADILVKYVQGDISSIMDLIDYFTLVVGMDEETAEAVVERVTEKLEEEADEDDDAFRPTEEEGED